MIRQRLSVYTQGNKSDNRNCLWEHLDVGYRRQRFQGSYNKCIQMVNNNKDGNYFTNTNGSSGVEKHLNEKVH